jgi:DNA polymerase/3'-5' exonuclease PolX
MESPLDSIVNESNRLLYQAFVSITKQYAAIGEIYRSKALEKSSKVISLYPQEITSGYQLKGIPGIGIGTMRRINLFICNGDIKIEEHEYTRAAKKARVQQLATPQPVAEQPVAEPVIDILIPAKRKYNVVVLYKNQYKLLRETEQYYIFT